MLSLELGQNLLAENNDFKLIIDNEEDLAGLPPSVIDAAADEAKTPATKENGCLLLPNQAGYPSCSSPNAATCAKALSCILYAWG